MTTFTVLKFFTAEGAGYMLSIIQKLQEQHLIQIEDGAILTWPLGARKPKTKQLNQLNGVSTLGEAFWGMLFGLLFSVAFFGAADGSAIGTLAGHFAHYGIDEHFINRIRDTITEGTSALFLLTSREIASVKGKPFEIISITLSKEQDARLREAFGEENSAVITGR